jgi:hypothetical protein
MQKAALGQSEGSEGERKQARWRGQEEDEQRQKAMGRRTMPGYERRPSVALGRLGARRSYVAFGLAPGACINRGRLETLEGCAITEDGARPDLLLLAAVLDVIISFMRSPLMNSVVNPDTRGADVRSLLPPNAPEVATRCEEASSYPARDNGCKHCRRNKALLEWTAVCTPQDVLHLIDSVYTGCLDQSFVAADCENGGYAP